MSSLLVASFMLPFATALAGGGKSVETVHAASSDQQAKTGGGNSLTNAKWTKHPAPPGLDDTDSIAWSGKEYVAASRLGKVFRSEDLQTWTETTPAKGSYLTTSAFVGSRFFVGGFGVLWTSSDGMTWTDCGIATNHAPFGFAEFNSRVFAVCANGTILASSDRKNWTVAADRVVAQGIYRFTPMAVASSRVRLVAAGIAELGDYSFRVNGGGIATSSDGNKWNIASRHSAGQIFSVVWTGDEFAAVTTGGVLLLSKDGDRWTESKLPVEFAMHIAWTGSEYVVGAGDGIILTGKAGKWTKHRPGGARCTSRVIWTGTRLLALQRDVIYSAVP